MSVQGLQFLTGTPQRMTPSARGKWGIWAARQPPPLPPPCRRCSRGSSTGAATRARVSRDVWEETLLRGVRKRHALDTARGCTSLPRQGTRRRPSRRAPVPCCCGGGGTRPHCPRSRRWWQSRRRRPSHQPPPLPPPAPLGLLRSAPRWRRRARMRLRGAAPPRVARSARGPGFPLC